jgi:eukaryotic-like serine/threonine-protein kinase
VISVRLGELADAATEALLRPVAADWSAPTSAMRRLEIVAGPDLEAQCRQLGDLPVGSAAITRGADLSAAFVVSVVVRSAEEPVTEAGVRRALQNGLRRLGEWGIHSVAMPPLGTGAGNLDAEVSAQIMIPLLREQLARGSVPAAFEIVVDTEYERDAFERVIAAASAL